MRRDQADSVLLILLRANRTKLRSKTNPTFTPPVPMAAQSRMALRASYRQSGSNPRAFRIGTEKRRSIARYATSELLGPGRHLGTDRRLGKRLRDFASRCSMDQLDADRQNCRNAGKGKRLRSSATG